MPVENCCGIGNDCNISTSLACGSHRDAILINQRFLYRCELRLIMIAYSVLLYVYVSVHVSYGIGV
jgi:hypothetical protein